MRSFYTTAILVLLRVWKAAVSPLFGQSCRFLPSCSDYASAVLVSHGPLAGGALTLRRICRCRPGGGSGYDPPPVRAQALKCEA